MTDGDPDVMPSLWHQQQHAMIDAEAKRHAIDARRVFAAAKSLVLGRVRNELLDQRRALDSLRRVYRKTSAAYFRIPCTTMEAWANYGAEKEWNELVEAARDPAVWDRLVDTFDTRETQP